MSPETTSAAERRSRSNKRNAARRVALAGPSPATERPPAPTAAAVSRRASTRVSSLAAVPKQQPEEITVKRSKRIAQRVALARFNPACPDWAGMLPFPAVENIAGRLRDHDVVDFLHLRMVCKRWKEGSSARNPRDLGADVIDHTYHPRRWILLTEPPPEATPTRRRLLNVTTRKTIKVDLPELVGHAVVPGPAAAPEGMLVARNETTLAVRLLNPLTRHVVDFPTLLTLLLQQQPASAPAAGTGTGTTTTRTNIPSDNDEFREDHEVTAAGFAGASAVVVVFGNVNRMAVARPGDVGWTLVGGLLDPEHPLVSTGTFQGRFYCVDRTHLLVLDMEHRLHPELVVAVNMEREFRTVGMVDDGGRLMLVCSREQGEQFDRSRGRSFPVTHMELFHVHLREQTLLPIQDLGERAVFTGPRGAVLLPNTNYYFSVDPGAVYFRFRTTQTHFGEFHVRKGQTGYITMRLWGRLGEHVASYVTTFDGIFN